MIVKNGNSYKIEEKLTADVKIQGFVSQMIVAEDINRIYLNDNVSHLRFKGEKVNHRLLGINYLMDMQLDGNQNPFEHDIEIHCFIYNKA